MHTINNAICLLIAAAIFAMIGIEAGTTAYPTHSGTQPLSPHAPHAPTPLSP